MLINSNEILEFINELKHEYIDYTVPVKILDAIKKHIHDIEASQAMNNARHKYVEELAGLKDK